MSNDLIIESDKAEKLEDVIEEDPAFEESLCGNIANLSASLSSLSEIDGGMMSKAKQAKLARMKRLVFDALAFYCDCLPQVMEEGED